ncbi:MAG: EF-P beta-lysylation protein EpmB, partial [Lysobacterales bacterium]
ADELAARDRWRAALDYIAGDDSVQEVILSGGDPLALATGKLAEFTDALAGIGHVRSLRLHTRLPIVLPERVDAALLAWLGGLPWPVTVVVHANHGNEIDEQTSAALHALRDGGAHLLNQSVLLAGVNDSLPALEQLSWRLHQAATLPYYLHLLDKVAGAAHFHVDEVAARHLHAQLRARLPGYLLPRLVREIAGEPAKTPL